MAHVVRPDAIRNRRPPGVSCVRCVVTPAPPRLPHPLYDINVHSVGAVTGACVPTPPPPDANAAPQSPPPPRVPISQLPPPHSHLGPCSEGDAALPPGGTEAGTPRLRGTEHGHASGLPRGLASSPKPCASQRSCRWGVSTGQSSFNETVPTGLTAPPPPCQTPGPPNAPSHINDSSVDGA